MAGIFTEAAYCNYEVTMGSLGKYIVIEGNDGTGKSTQVAKLADYFRERGRTVCVVEEPGSEDPEKSTPIADELRKVIKNGDLARSAAVNVALFSAARRELWQEKIQPALERGEIVLSARNYISTLVYQGRGEGYDESEILRLTKLFTGERYLRPDIMIILSLSHDKREERIAMRGELKNPDAFESRGQDFQEKVDDGYLEIAKDYDIPVVLADGNVEEVHDMLIDEIEINGGIDV
ncbi:dTMP kinase [Candidatus Nanosynbacter sp. TM7-074]|uniref:Thymidylate kinase n=1 Tax=Candidatus Nanosynbacter sp. TM7-074 TaxID=3158573 RepID=A0AB39J8C8_9BACT